MLPPVLFYGLAAALLFFGVLRLTYLGVFADKRPPAKPAANASEVDVRHNSDDADEGDEGETIDNETRSERYRRPPRMGFGLVSFMGFGRMSPAKRHTVMGGLWILLGLYMAWTGFNLSRQQQSAANPVEDSAPMRVIRARVQQPEPSAPPEPGHPSPSPPAEMKRAPDELAKPREPAKPAP